MRKRLIALLMVMVMLFSLPVYANDSIIADDNVELLRLNTALVSLEARDISTDLLKELLTYNFEITNNSVVEVLPINNSTDTAICVSSIENNIIKRDVLISFYEDESGNTRVNNLLAVALEENSAEPLYYADFGESNWNIHGQAYMYTDTHGGWSLYFRPYKCEFYYTSGSLVNVTDIIVNYLTCGYLCDQTTYSQLSSELYEHDITAVSINPVRYQIYSATEHLPSGRVMFVPLGLHEGQFLGFACRVNGVNKSYNVLLTDNSNL